MESSELKVNVENILGLVCKDLKLGVHSVSSVISLREEGSTVPFIARYRKDKTGGLDEVAIRAIFDRYDDFVDLTKRKHYILSSIASQKKLTSELEKSINETWDKVRLEDLYLPYKPKRKTKGSIAIEMGLLPFADVVWNQEMIEGDPNLEASKYIDESKGVKNLNDVFLGVIYIIGERISDLPSLRQKIRKIFIEKGVVKSEKSVKYDGKPSKFDTYFDYKEKVSELLFEKGAHRYLALTRGESEKILSVTLDVPEDEILGIIKSETIINENSIFSNIMEEGAKDAYSRLIRSSLTNETRTLIKNVADENSIKVFSKNLKTILLSPPFGGKRVLAIDPAFKTGCKTVMLSETGDYLESTVIFPHTASEDRIKKSEELVLEWIKRYSPEAIVIGNGTASRETDSFVKNVIKNNNLSIVSAVVSESGASIYSASKVAREEFPNLDLTVRGAISIGRRFQDPLAELVKIDPKSVGVGQYQHDVNKTKLKKALDDVVGDCVNFVGVDVNTASSQLLSYVSGVGPTLAQNIIKFRSKSKFSSREDFKNVTRFTDKVFEQSVGFLRVAGAENILDRTGIHPETYEIVNMISRDLGVAVSELIGNIKLLRAIDINKYVNEQFGPLTIKDIIEELKKPGRDPRDKFEVLTFAEGINDIKDLKNGMVLNGIVTNVTNFGAFVDVGVHTDGLVHTSEIANRFITDPSECVSVGDHVKVLVLGVDLEKKQVSLSIKQAFVKDKSVPKRAPKIVDNRKPKVKKNNRPNRNVKDGKLSSNPFAALANLSKK